MRPLGLYPNKRTKPSKSFTETTVTWITRRVRAYIMSLRQTWESPKLPVTTMSQGPENRILWILISSRRISHFHSLIQMSTRETKFLISTRASLGTLRTIIGTFSRCLKLNRISTPNWDFCSSHSFHWISSCTLIHILIKISFRQ